VLGVDHHTATAAVRESLAFDGRKGEEGLARLVQTFPGNEFVILSTCNRVEIYVAGAAEDIPDPGALTAFLADFHGQPLDRLAIELFYHYDQIAISHLFRVAASLESLVLGEGQILGQVREAFLAAKERKAVGPILHRVFEHAIQVGKRVRAETGMDQGKLSVASVAVDVARGVFNTFSDKTVLVIGAGKMADLTLRHLKALNPGRILVTNRNVERAETAAAKWGGQAVPYDRLFQALIDADVVVSTTAADEPIVTYDQYARVQRARRNRLVLILDIAIPRDFDEAIGKLDQVCLFNVDDLKAQAERNRVGRQRAIDPALVIIERETAECYAALRTQRYAGAVLRQLGESTDAIRERELGALFAALPDLSPEQRDAIAHHFNRFQNKLLHAPRSALRTAVAERVHEHHHSLLNAVKHLFGLADG
jgi:glutamyl-tRNA reductase